MNDMTKSITGFKISNVIDNELLENGWHKYLFISGQWHFDEKITCRRRDLSPRPFDYESNALTKLSYPGAQLPDPNDFLNIIYFIQSIDYL